MDKPTIVILSRERSEIGTTWRIFPNAIIALNAAEEDVYRGAGLDNEFWLHDQNTSVGVRNYVLDRAGPGAEIIMLDDDISKVGEFVALGPKKNKLVELEGAAFYERLCRGFDLARKNNYHLFGVAPTPNPLYFNPAKPVKTSVFVNGPMMCVRVTDLRFDPACVVKCDYDFTIQHIHSGRGSFRLEKLWQENDFDTLPGGRSCYKTDKDRALSFHYLTGKWPSYLRPNPNRRYEVIIKKPKRKK